MKYIYPIYPLFLAILVVALLSACPPESPDIHPTLGDAGHGVDIDEGDEDTAQDPVATLIEFDEPEFLVELNRNRRPEATVFDQYGDEMENIFVAWESSDPSVIEISSGGFALGRALGTADLTATAGNAQAQWPARVVSARVAAISIVPATFTLLIDDEVQYLVTLRDATNSVIEEEIPLAWSTTDPSVATIDGQGLAKALAEGQVEVIASVDGVEARADLFVTQADVDSIAIYPRNLGLLYPGQTLELEGRVFDLEDNPLFGHQVFWSTSNPEVATVDQNGVVEAVAAGQASISIELGALEDSVAVEVVFTVQEVVSGGGFSCARAIEELFCWGANDAGQLAQGALSAATSTAQLSIFDGEVTDISLGTSHGCLIDGLGTAHCWGQNDYGQLGVAAGAPHPEPQEVDLSATLVAISAGADHSCALSDGGTVYCWGRNDSRQSGHGGSSTHQPQALSTSTSFVALSAGGRHSCAISAGNQGYCWGANDRGQLGGETQALMSSTPRLVQGGYTFAQISTGADHSCGVGISGLPVCWGAGDRGQLGNSGTADRSVPITLALEPGQSVFIIESGAHHSCALMPGGQVLCWGAADDGRLGVDTPDDALSPLSTTSAETFVELAPGHRHTCGRTSDHRLLCWGDAPGAGFLPQEIDFDY